jgi:hypothetical protein
MSRRGFRTLLRERYDCRSCGSQAGVACVTSDGRPTQPHQDRWDQHAASVTRGPGNEDLISVRPALEGCFDCG